MTTPEIKTNIPEVARPQTEHGEVLKEAPAPAEAKIQPSPGPFTVQPADDTQTQQVPADDDANIVTITVPATPQQLEDWAKGSPDNSLTWFAFYWIRMIKKAIAHGYRVMTAQPAV